MMSSVRPLVGTALRAPPLPHAHSELTPPCLPSISVITSYEPFSVGVRSQLTAVAALVAVQLPASVTVRCHW
jgi:hypothetical protein